MNTSRHVVVLLLGALALLAAGCGGTRPPSTAADASDLGFSSCMRVNGASNYPDPDRAGHLVKESLQQLGVSSHRFESAEHACQHLLPNSGATSSAAQAQRVRALSLQFSRCVRAHGVPSFPDPDSTGRIPDPATLGIDQAAPTFEAANRACAKYRPPYIPSNAAYHAWVRTHRP